MDHLTLHYALAGCTGQCAPLILQGLDPISKFREFDAVFHWIHALGIPPRFATLFQIGQLDIFSLLPIWASLRATVLVCTRHALHAWAVW